MAQLVDQFIFDLKFKSEFGTIFDNEIYSFQDSCPFVIIQSLIVVSETVADEIWKTLFNTNRIVRYYGELTNSYLKKYRWIRYGLLVLATGQVGVLSISLPDTWGIFLLTLLPCLIILLVVLEFVTDYGRKASMSHVISMKCSEVENDIHRLWSDYDIIEDEEAVEKLSLISSQLWEATGKASEFGIVHNSRLNEKCAKQASQYLTNYYTT